MNKMSMISMAVMAVFIVLVFTIVSLVSSAQRDEDTNAPITGNESSLVEGWTDQ